MPSFENTEPGFATILALAVAPDGTIYAGGSFTDAGGAAASNIAAYDPGSETWRALGDGTSGPIYALAVASDGTVYVGGSFTGAGGLSALRLAAYDPGAGTWSAFSGTAPNRTVRALELAADGTLYVGGEFTSVGGVATAGIAAYDTGAGTWSAVGTATGAGVGGVAEVYTLHLDQTDDVLYAGGNFTSIDGVSANSVAGYDRGTATWDALGGGVVIASSSGVEAITGVPGGIVYVGGRISEAGGVPVNNIAAYDPDAGTWSALGAGADFNVRALELVGGTLYAGGSFETAGGVAVHHVAAWNGAMWSALDSGASDNIIALAVNGSDVLAAGAQALVQNWDGAEWSILGPSTFDSLIEVVVVAGDGSIYVGGDFTTTPGGFARHLAVFSGGQWSPVGGGLAQTSDDVSVADLAIDDDGTLFAAGEFDVAGGVAVSNVAAWDGTSWDDLDGGTDDAVNALAVASDGTVYAGGVFTTAGGVAANRAAAWDGADWSQVGDITDGFVYDLFTDSDGTLYLGGLVVTVGSPATVISVAALDGGAWSTLGGGFMSGGSTGFVLVVQELPDGRIAAGGIFDEANGVPAQNVAAWNGSAWEPLGGGIGPVTGSSVRSLHVDLGGQVYAGGLFGETVAGDIVTTSLAVLDPVSDTWADLDSELGESSSAFDLANATNGDLIAVGSFTEAGGVPAVNIAQYDLAFQPSLPDNEGWTALGDGTNSTVLAVAVAPDGTVYAGGLFTSAGAVSANRVAAWDGFGWGALGAGVNGLVFALDVAPDGTLYAGGSFTSAGGGTADRVAFWDGTSWDELDTGVDNTVYALSVAPDGTVYAGGAFTTAGSLPASRVASYDPVIGGWSPLGAGVGGTVNGLGVAGDGVLYAGGDFTSAGGASANHVAAWNGTDWSTLGVGLNDHVEALMVDPLGTVYVGGFFTTAGGSPASRVAQWDGTAWTSLGTGTDTVVRSLTHDRLSGLYVGGTFTTAGGDPAANIARWTTPLAITLNGSAGWRMLSAPSLGVTLNDLLGPIWTQGMPGSDAPEADPVTYCNVFVHDETVRTDANNDGTVSTADGWGCIASLNATLAPGDAVLVYVYDDDDNDGTAEGFPKTLAVSGGLGTPTIALPYAADGLSFTNSTILPAVQEGFNYVGNPTPLALDADLFDTSGLAATVYTWDPTLFGGDYRTWNGTAGDLTNGVLPPLQGFFVQADAASPTLSIPVEATRTSGVPYYGRRAQEMVVRLVLSAEVGGADIPVASTFVHTHGTATSGLDRLDGLRLTPMRWPYATLYSQADGAALAVQAVPALTEPIEVPLGVATAGYTADVPMAISWDALDTLPDGDLVGRARHAARWLDGDAGRRCLGYRVRPDGVGPGSVHGLRQWPRRHGWCLERAGTSCAGAAADAAADRRRPRPPVVRLRGPLRARLDGGRGEGS